MDVIGFGAMNLDLVYQVKHILLEGEATVKGFSQHAGGSAANTVHALSRLGLKAGFLGAVGTDPEGAFLFEECRGIGVDTRGLVAKVGATGRVLCITDERAHRALYVLPGGNDLLKSEDIDLSYANRARLIHLSSFAGEEQFELQKDLVARLDPDIKVSFSPGSLYAPKGCTALLPILRRTQVLFANKREIEEMTGDEFTEGARDCLQHGCGAVVVTLGEGLAADEIGVRAANPIVAYVVTAEEDHIIEAPAIVQDPAPDGIGAGDAFAAGFLFGFLRHKDLPTCGALGHLLATCALSGVGARAGLPTLAELDRKFREVYGKAL